jgi:hypothetical protein
MVDRPNLSSDERRAISEVKMAMVKAAHVNIKNIFPGLGSKSEKVHHSKNPSHTKKGLGRKHQQGKA